MGTAQELKGLVHSKERLYYAIIVVVGLAVYGGIGFFIWKSEDPAVPLAMMLLYALPISLLIFFARGLALGHIRGNGIRVSERQFPELLEVATRHARTFGLKSLPNIYILESGGILNAFATRFLGRNFVVVYADVLALAEERGKAAVSFIVAHELAHVARGHLRHQWLTLPGRMVPYLGAAYSRAREYTCDRFGAHCQPDGAVDGLLVLAAGRELYRHVDAREYAAQVQSEAGFWVRRAELMSSHPILPKRVAALLEARLAVPAYSPMSYEVASARRTA